MPRNATDLASNFELGRPAISEHLQILRLAALVREEVKKELGEIRVERVYAQAPSKLWRALTDPELVARWWGRGDIHAEVGHRFDMQMGAWGMQLFEVIGGRARAQIQLPIL